MAAGSLKPKQNNRMGKLINLKNLSLVLLGLLIIVLYSYRLNSPSGPYFDEYYYTGFFHSFIYEHRYNFFSVHPLLWGLLTWPFLTLFGRSIAVWRIVSLIAGLLSILGVYALAKRITSNTLTALFAAFFFAFDCISLTQARIAIMNSLCLLFMILSLFIFLKYWFNPKGSGNASLLGAGVCLGLALSTKLTAISMVLMIYFLFIQKVLKNKSDRLGSLLKGMVFLFILPVVIYFAVYSWMLSLPGFTWHDIWNIQQINFHYHLKVAAAQAHGYSSAWWGWPLLLRPEWFYFAHQKGTVNGIICIGNPAIFWLIPVMTAYLCWTWARHGRSAAVGLILFGFLGQWLFYALSPRVSFFPYFYFSMPFVAMGLAWICAQLWKTGRAGKLLVSFYLVLVFGMFIYWYPLLTGLTISDQYYQTHIWLSSWI